MPTAVSAQAALVGQWQLVDLPSIPIAAAMLPNGKLVTWSSDQKLTFGSGLGQTNTILFDPQTLRADDILVTNTSHDMFCPGTAMLADGRVFVNGGGATVSNSSSYNSASATWKKEAPMFQPRWYNSSVTLPNGDVFTLGGNIHAPTISGDGSGERWSPGRGWTPLPGAVLDPLLTSDPINRSQEHPRMFVAPNGKLFIPGPTPNMQWYDVSGDGSIESAGTRGNDTFSQNDSTVMFAQGRLLKAGGNVNYDRTGAADSPSSATAYVIDINQDVPVVRQVQSLKRGRAFANGVALPSGDVLVLGGLDNGKAFSDTGAVLTPELFDPTTETWSDVSAMTVPRTYHSVGILMPDGRVFAGGGGQCNTTCDVNHLNAEIFSPAYLFQGDRPVITAAPSSTDWGATFSVTTTGVVSSFAWIRMSSVTHSVNSDQRRVFADAARKGGGRFTITAPANGNLAPPGYYMLFALHGKVPSVAKIIRIGGSIAPVADPKNLALGRPATQSSTWGNGDAALAVDGNTLSVTDTGLSQTNSDPQAWWQVDLGSTQAIGRVHVWRRTDCCLDRLADFDVKLSRDGDAWTSTLHVAGQAGQPSILDFSGKTGRYVRVQLTGTNFLALTEVEVFAP
jgi:galactose oxidase